MRTKTGDHKADSFHLLGCMMQVISMALRTRPKCNVTMFRLYVRCIGILHFIALNAKDSPRYNPVALRDRIETEKKQQTKREVVDDLVTSQEHAEWENVWDAVVGMVEWVMKKEKDLVDRAIATAFVVLARSVCRLCNVFLLFADSWSRGETPQTRCQSLLHLHYLILRHAELFQRFLGRGEYDFKDLKSFIVLHSHFLCYSLCKQNKWIQQ
jgi:hypothetical protein